MQPGEIREHFIDRLAAIFGSPKNAMSLAEELTRHAGTATPDDLGDLADRLIATRKTKGFPSASELIAALKTIVPKIAVAADGMIRFEGEVRMTWILADDPRWHQLCAIARRADHRNRHYPMASKYAPGLGSFFRTEFVDGVPLSEVEAPSVMALYASALREVGKAPPAP